MPPNVVFVSSHAEPSVRVVCADDQEEPMRGGLIAVLVAVALLGATMTTGMLRRPVAR